MFIHFNSLLKTPGFFVFYSKLNPASALATTLYLTSGLRVVLPQSVMDKKLLSMILKDSKTTVSLGAHFKALNEGVLMAPLKTLLVGKFGTQRKKNPRFRAKTEFWEIYGI